MIKKALIFSIFCSIITMHVFAQHTQTSSIDSNQVLIFTLQDIDNNTDLDSVQIFGDTLSRNFHQFNPAKRYYTDVVINGNTGLACNSMYYLPSLISENKYSAKSFVPYVSSNENPNLYYGLHPFTELFYSMGSKREQYFKVNHFHSIKNVVFLGVQYRILSSPGRDNFRQKANDHALNTYLYYQTKNKRYGMFVTYDYSRVANQENGGLVNDSIYLDYRKGNNSATPSYNLENAESKFVANEIKLKQYVYFGRGKKSDTTTKDSIKYEKKFKTRLIHILQYSSMKEKFSNGINNGYFPIIPFDTAAISDSSKYWFIANKLTFTNSAENNFSKSKFLFWLSANYSYNNFSQKSYRNLYSDLFPDIKFTYKIKPWLSISASGEYHLLQENQNDYKAALNISTALKFHDKDFGRINLDFIYGNIESDWKFRHFYSTYFTWENSFKKEKDLILALNYKYKKLAVGFNYYNIANYVYFGSDARPVQYLGENLNFIQFVLDKKFIIKKFEINNHLVIQYCDKENLIRSPRIIAGQSYVFSSFMFKKALYANIGLDLNYNTSWLANAYQPATNSYYLQNNRNIGNYLYVDAFINLKVQRFRVFVLLSNALSGLIGYDSFTVPHYPMQDRTFKFGVDWIFHN